MKLISGEKIIFDTTLLSEPKISNLSQMFGANYKNQRITVFTPITPEMIYGDDVKISGTLKSRVINGKESFSVYAKIEAVKSSENKLLAISSLFRQKIIAFFKRNLSPNYSGLMLGIVFGIKEYIPSDFLKDLKVAGVMHIIAASGMNVTLVGAFLSSIFLMFLKRQIALLATISGIIMYAVLAGMEASIIRASIMGILVFSASIFGQQMWASYALLLTGYLMLFYDPGLLYDIGFQLSFFATIGLLSTKQIFKNKLLDGFQTTIFAQVATLPILIANFGTYSLWSVVVNGLVLWTIPSLMILGGLSAILSLFIEPIAQIILYLSLPILIFFEWVIKFFSGLGALIRFETLSWQLIVGYYCILVGFILVRKE